MSELQKIIKYLAMAFAIFLVFSIVTGIMSIALSFTNIFDDNDNITEKFNDLDVSGEVKILDIGVKSVSVTLKEGNKLKAETNNKDINIKQDKNKLYITQKKYNWFNSSNGELIVYIPKDFTFDAVSLQTGAGKVNVEELVTNKLYLELGAGKVDINKLMVIDETEIDGGAGSITIKNGSLNDLDLDMGVGKLSLTSIIKGNNEIDSGVGEVELNLIGSKDDYKIRVDKGIGSATIDKEDIKSDTFYGEGNNLIDIDGGIGSIKINFIGE